MSSEKLILKLTLCTYKHNSNYLLYLAFGNIRCELGTRLIHIMSSGIKIFVRNPRKHRYTLRYFLPEIHKGYAEIHAHAFTRRVKTLKVSRKKVILKSMVRSEALNYWLRSSNSFMIRFYARTLGARRLGASAMRKKLR